MKFNWIVQCHSDFIYSIAVVLPITHIYLFGRLPHKTILPSLRKKIRSFDQGTRTKELRFSNVKQNGRSTDAMAKNSLRFHIECNVRFSTISITVRTATQHACCRSLTSASSCWWYDIFGEPCTTHLPYPFTAFIRAKSKRQRLRTASSIVC